MDPASALAVPEDIGTATLLEQPHQCQLVEALWAAYALAGHAPSTGLDLLGHAPAANLTCQIMLEQVPPTARPRVAGGRVSGAGLLPSAVGVDGWVAWFTTHLREKALTFPCQP